MIDAFAVWLGDTIDIYVRYVHDQAISLAKIVWLDIQIAWCDLKIFWYS